MTVIYSGNGLEFTVVDETPISGSSNYAHVYVASPSSDIRGNYVIKVSRGMCQGL